jgi:tRNA A-37 threonylcarbamoyl transferase component Bud32
MRSFSDSVVSIKRLLHSECNLILIKEAKALRKLSSCLTLRQLIGFVSHNCSLSLKFVDDRKALAPISPYDALTTINPREVSGALPADNKDMVELQPHSLLSVTSAIAVKSPSISPVDSYLGMSSFLCSGFKEEDLDPVTAGDTTVLGEGTTSSVTLRKLRSKDSIVVVKRLNPGESKSMMIKEAKILRKLDHCPAFPQLMGFIDHKDSPSLILEFVGDWNTLTSVSIFDALSTVSSNPRLLTSEWLGVAGDIAGGLSMLHRAGFVHGDLHNNNIMLYRHAQHDKNQSGRSWQAKIIDLGSAEYIYTPSPLLQLYVTII